MQTGRKLFLKTNVMRKETKINSKPVSTLSLPVVNPDAAGIDVSAKMHMVAVPAGRDTSQVKQFGAFTEDLHAIARWLQFCKITTVAMESTGVYWKQLYIVLLQYGFQVSLVNARHVKNVTGRKTDIDDAQWIQKLHSCGLLNSCFLPDDVTESLRSLVRHRKSLLEDSSKYVLRMQKALELMNIKVQGVLSDITGKSGLAIINAIIAGYREPEYFLQLVDAGVKADTVTLIKSLTGNWREEQLFLLEENYTLYKLLKQRIESCDKKIESFLQLQGAALTDGIIEPLASIRKKKVKTSPASMSGPTCFGSTR
jgi:transposase